jgi:hypothetical protein
MGSKKPADRKLALCPAPENRARAAGSSAASASDLVIEPVMAVAFDRASQLSGRGLQGGPQVECC